MCFFAASTMLQAGSLAATAASGVMAAQAASTQAKANKAIAERNAAMAEASAKDALARGEQEAIQTRQKASQVAGAQRVSLASHGLDLGYGTASDLQEQTDFFATQDVNTVRDNAKKAAFNASSQAQIYQMQASTYNPTTAALGGLLSTAGTVADRWYKYRAGTVS